METDISELHLSVQERIQLAITRLPALTKDDVPLEDSCPICLNPFDGILSSPTAESPNGGGQDTDEVTGVTKLAGCGHIFCRTCLVEWIRGRHGSCPSCRDVFSSIKPASDSDNESSDGDYVPGDDEEDEEDDFYSDGSVFDMDIEEELERDTDMEEAFDAAIDTWDQDAADAEMENWGLSDGEGYETVSEGEGLIVSVELPVNDEAEVYSEGETSGALPCPRDDSAGTK